MKVEAHRPGPFKQQNKSHKTGHHRSKGQLDREGRGRSDVKTSTKRKRRELSKVDRKNRANQLRSNKKDETLNRKRRLGESSSPPFLTTILSLCEEHGGDYVLRNLLNSDEESTITNCDRNVTFMTVPRVKQRFSFIVPDPDDLFSVLDALKVSDTLLLLWPADGELSQDRETLLQCCLAHGLPAYLNLIQGFSQLNGKRKETCRKQLTKNLENWSLETKFYSYDTISDAKVILRQIGCGAKKPLNLQRYRPHLLVESNRFELSDAQDALGTWKLTGYLRGPPLSVNGLVHIPGIGDFQMKQIDLIKDAHPLESGRRNLEELEEERKVLEVADEKKQESLTSTVCPDPMEGEQTWPQEDELKEAESGRFKVVPKGTSKYQAEWILDEDEDKNKEDRSEDEDDDDSMNEIESAVDDQSTAGDEQDDRDETETIPMSESDNTDRYDAAMDVDEEKKLLEQFRKERENELFPDEVDTPYDVSSKIRFQRYRGLKSFRTSSWDTNENLPSDYAKIFQFENFGRTKKRILNEEREGAMHGWYVCLHLANVPKQLIEPLSPTSTLIAFGVLPHEQKVSVINCVLRKQESCKLSIKSKDKLIFHVGYRRFSANPIFSQHTNGDKHKFERFLSDNSAVVASMFAPIVFPPASVLAFKIDSKGRHRFVATGNVMDANPSRIIVKRIILSGHPFKINKRTAVIRYMFFTREDILWFKPVELRTKYGRRGHIKEPLGTHGHMKCHFDKPLTPSDTVLMDLYKRVFPKWNYDPIVPKPLRNIESESVSEIMDS